MKRSNFSHTGLGLFHRVDEAYVIISKRGNFEQRELFQRGEVLYIESTKEKFVRLLPNGTTSVSALSWDEIIGAKVTENDLELRLEK